MTGKNYERLADRILVALTLALEQKDAAIAETLGRALEMAMTSGAGGKDFVERREFSDDVHNALQKLDSLKKSAKKA